MPSEAAHKLTRQIIMGMVTGIVVGSIINVAPSNTIIDTYIVNGVLDVGGKIFISIIKMLVVPIVFISLVCGTCQLRDSAKLGRLAGKTLLLYLCTTAIAITLALLISHLFGVGAGSEMARSNTFAAPPPPSLKQTLIDIIPTNPFAAMVQGKMLQVIVFSLLFGTAIAWSGKSGERIGKFFSDLDVIVMNLITMLMKVTPLGVFCLISAIFAKMGFSLIQHLIGYFMTVVSVLLIHVLFTNSLLLKLLVNLNPITFFRKVYSAMIFAFSTSSSNASIPVVLNTAEEKLGVDNSVASFTIPLGATINMDGTSIMQGVATVFIANVYHIPIGITGFLTVILTATLASVGTAGVPGVGLITLAMVLKQVGLPVEGIALIIGVDRLLDMLRTAVNITGDCAVSCIVAKSENSLSHEIYDDV